MDVRCDKCQTEYELDEARLKPGGVTVKCTTCGHLFRVRKRATTAVGLGLSSGSSGVHRPSTTAQSRQPKPGTIPGPLKRAEAAGSAGVPQPVAGAASHSKPTKGRNWLIRLPTGKVETCHELATLQQWIISGRVSRNSGISRSGATWKKLGDIEHLASFFEIADQARSARHELSAPMPQPTPQPTEARAPARDTPKRPVIAPSNTRSTPAHPLSAQRDAASVSEPPNVATRTASPSPKPMSDVQFPKQTTSVRSPSASSEFDQPEFDQPEFDQPELDTPTASEGTAVGKGPATRAKQSTDSRSKRESAEWIRDGKDPANPGPTGGLTRGIPTADVAFGKSQIRPLDEAGNSGFGRLSVDGDEDGAFDDELDEFAPARGGVGRWIVAVSLLVMAGAAVAIYFLVLRTPDTEKSASTGDSIDTAVADGQGTDATLNASGAATVGTTPDNPNGSDPVTPNLAASRDDVLSQATSAVLGFDKSALEASNERLAGLDNANDDVVVLEARARVHAALAQHFIDEAALAGNKSKAKTLKKQADTHVVQAWKWTKKVLERNRKAPTANALMADITRLQGKRSRQVDRYLKVVRKNDKRNREALLIQALTYVRDKRERKGRVHLKKLTTGDGAMDKSGDVRPTYRLALLDYRGENHEDARERVNKILALQPEHASARALLAQISDATAVDTSDPLPPEDGRQPDNTENTNSGGDTYESLLSRADRKAEYGDCGEALRLYEKAVEINALGVAALTGMGYCYIDKKKFSSAHAKFKAALVAAHNFQDAMWGIAEAYQQQGNKAKAIKAFEAFLEVHGNSRRADMAKRQIERLGGVMDDAGASTTTDEKPTDGKPTDGKPTDEKPTDEKPTDGKSTDGKPTDGKPTDGKPSDTGTSGGGKTDETATDKSSPDGEGSSKPTDPPKPADGKSTEPSASRASDSSES